MKNLDFFVFIRSFSLLSSILGSCSPFTSSTMIALGQAFRLLVFDSAFLLFMEIVHRIFIHGGCGGAGGRGLRLR
jgi:hypothetical protein